MFFTELTEEEYQAFWENHPLKTFLSSIEIGKLRNKSNWKTNYVGIKKNNKIIAATMLLSKKKSFYKYEFYSPRGFLLNYNNKELLLFFSKKIKQYIKKNNGYILRIDPYIINKERDINGIIKENGKDNTKIIKYLKEIGYKKVPINKNEQVSWMFSLNLENKTEKDILNEMKQNTRNIINKTKKIGISIKELSLKELPRFYNILKETSKRHKFKIRKQDYYNDMYKLFKPKKEVKYLITELNLNNYIKNLNKEREVEIKKLLSKTKKNSKKNNTRESINNLSKKIIKAKDIMNKTNSDIITLSGSMFILIKPEIIYLSSGNYEEYLNFNSQYLLQWELIKYGLKNGYKKYNFYGIPENIDKHPDNYGIYEFKKGFNGYVEELIGEYELPIGIYYYIQKFFKEVKYALHI